jgi:hypothetical protein
MFPRSRPLCPKCAATTMLARITPGPSGFDIRTFECPACDNVHQLVVALVSLPLFETISGPTEKWPRLGAILLNYIPSFFIIFLCIM